MLYAEFVTFLHNKTATNGFMLCFIQYCALTAVDDYLLYEGDEKVFYELMNGGQKVAFFSSNKRVAAVELYYKKLGTPSIKS